MAISYLNAFAGLLFSRCTPVHTVPEPMAASRSKKITRPAADNFSKMLVIHLNYCETVHVAKIVLEKF